MHASRNLAYAGLPLQLNQVGLDRLVSALNLPNPLVASVLTQTLQSLLGTVVEDPTALLEQLGGTLGFAVDPDAVAAAIGSGFRGSTFSVMLPLEPDTSGAYSTKLPPSSRSAMFSRAVRCPDARRRATAHTPRTCRKTRLP